MLRKLCVLLCLGGLPTSWAQSSFQFMSQSIAPDEVQSWMQLVSTSALPMTVIHGQHPDPVLTLIAGAHGDEYPAIFALQQLKRLIQPQHLHGSMHTGTSCQSGGLSWTQTCVSW